MTCCGCSACCGRWRSIGSRRPRPNFLRIKRSQTHRALPTGAPGHAELGMPPVKVKGPPPAERRPRTQ